METMMERMQKEKKVNATWKSKARLHIKDGMWTDFLAKQDLGVENSPVMRGTVRNVAEPSGFRFWLYNLLAHGFNL